MMRTGIDERKARAADRLEDSAGSIALSLFRGLRAAIRSRERIETNTLPRLAAVRKLAAKTSLIAALRYISVPALQGDSSDLKS